MTKKKSWLDDIKDYFDEVGSAIDAGQKWARENNIAGISATESVPLRSAEQTYPKKKETMTLPRRRTSESTQRIRAYLGEVEANLAKNKRKMQPNKKAGAGLFSGQGKSLNIGSEDERQRLLKLIEEEDSKARQERQNYFDEVSRMISDAQDWARENNVQGISATESIVPDFDYEAYEQQMQKAIEQRAHQELENAKRMWAYFDEVQKTIEAGQAFARENNAVGLSATESYFPIVYTEKEREEKQQLPGAMPIMDPATAYEQQQKEEIDRQIELAKNDVWTQYTLGGAFRPILEVGDGINGFLAEITGDSERFPTDNLERLDSYQQTLAPADTVIGRSLRGTADILARIGLGKILGLPWEIASGIANFGTGVSEAKEKGLPPSLWGINGALEFGKGTAIGSAAKSLGGIAGEQIADQLENLSPQQRAELAQALAEWLGVDFENLTNKVWEKLEEPAP